MSTDSRFVRMAVLLYSVVGYTFTMLVILYLIAFLAGFETHSAMRFRANQPFAVLINIGLLLLFGLQHSVMAREGFKQRLHRIAPQAAERSTYGFAAAGMILIVIVFWQPLPQVIWRADHNLLRFVLWAGFWLGIALAIASTFAISHFDFFGLRQGLLFWRRRDYIAPAFQTPLLYRLMRHPMMTGLLIAFWVVPQMTLGRFLFAAGMTVYILIGIRFEERSLERQLGQPYADYRRRTPAFFPRMRFGEKHHEEPVIHSPET